MRTLASIPRLTPPEFVLGDAERHGPHVAIVDPNSGREVTYRELSCAVRQMATAA